GLAVVAAEQWRIRRKTFTAQVEQAKAVNGLLAGATPPLRGDARPAVHVADELGDEELALTRRFVDLAFQEPDDWSNWTVIDQFQPAALRYQVDATVNALALQRYVHNPAFTGYLDEAQLRLIDRYQQKKVWGYWALENLWGNLEWDPDPGKKQNIMMTGYYGLSIGLYQTVSGDLRHSEPGAIRFRWNDRREFRYSLGELLGNLTADYVRSPWGMVVCEPNWIFALCNLRGGTALKVHDRVHGTSFWDQVKDGYYRCFEQEIVRPDGQINGHRSSRLGFGQVGVSLATDTRPLIPHVADRDSVLLRTICRQPDGTVRTPFAGDSSLLDPGNYTFHPLTAYAAVMEEAREVGDLELFDAAYGELRESANPRIDERGWLTVDGASMLAYTGFGRALFGRTGGWVDLVEKGMPEHWRTGPVVDAVPYPTAMVAKAVSDGADLDVVLRATNGGGRIEVGLARLVPGTKYTVDGAVDTDLVADDDGRATLTVDLDGRRELRVSPRA
ncbi:linalool dehydratase/isomerase domain-containing protein, partial [Pseudonocardia pini]|uniref:linalool dehydratase/isomerase domain-containing protein n=1 Tax=Pseudonocardia pini TaxID=2758030 RepID=UPI0015F0CAEF